MESKQFKELVTMLGLVSKLLALNITSQLESIQKDKILMLNRIGLSNNDIASVLDTTSNNVAVTVSQAKKDN